MKDRTRGEKAATWAALAASGVSMEAIGEKEGISRERVRQILRMEGYDARTGMRGAAPTDPFQVLLSLRDGRAVSDAETGALMGISAPTVRRTLERIECLASAKRLWRARQRRAKVEQVRRQIAEFVAEHGRIPGVQDAIQGRFPIAHTTVGKLFGTWNNAIEAAGYVPRQRGGAGHARRRSTGS